MLSKISALWELFRVGNEVADPVLWKTRQVRGNQIGAIVLALVGLAKVLGYELPVDEEAALLIGGGFVAVANVVLTITTTRKIGLPPEPEAAAEHKPPEDHYVG